MSCTLYFNFDDSVIPLVHCTPIFIHKLDPQSNVEDSESNPAESTSFHELTIAYNSTNLDGTQSLCQQQV